MRSEMRHGHIFVLISAVFAMLAGAAGAQPTDGNWGCAQGYGPGMMRDGYAGRMMGQGMMDGPGGCGPCADPNRFPEREKLNLSVDQVRNNMEQWLKRSGNPRLKVGKVAERDADTVSVEVVTAEKNVLVQRYDVNRHSGCIRPAR